MINFKAQDRMRPLVLTYQLDTQPEKVWRALSIPEFREQWLPTEALAVTEAIFSVPGQEVRYLLRDDEPPFFESIVTFRIRPNERGTELLIIHRPTDAGPGERFSAANSNQRAVMRAA